MAQRVEYQVVQQHRRSTSNHCQNALRQETDYFQPEDCQIVFIKSISFQAADINKDPASFPDMSNDPFTPAISRPPTTPQSAISDPFNPPALVELPTCPVCLERMDDTTGLATIFCQHVFHCACLQKWRGTGCPVCRYTQDEPLHKSKHYVDDDTGCSTCGADSNLWIWYVFLQLLPFTLH